MGELIRRAAAAKPIGFSGERLTAAASGQVEIEHYHRYLLARDYCRGVDVLDCASGEGYGAAMLAQVARRVVGVEIDEDAVVAARTEFRADNLEFLTGDARALPLGDATIDVAVTFETLEHLREQDKYLTELRRVLRPGGLLLVSTPDRDIYSPIGAPPNPFHQHELTRFEFEQLLRRHFANVAVAGQRPMIGSVILGEEAGVRSFERRSDEYLEASDGLARAVYLVALASDGPMPRLPSSVYIHRNDLDTDPALRREAELALHAARMEAAETAAVAQAEISDAKSAVAELEQKLLAAEARAHEGGLRERKAADHIANLERRVELIGTEVERLQHGAEETDVALTYARQRGEALEAHLAAATARAAAAEARAAELEAHLASEQHTLLLTRQHAAFIDRQLQEVQGSSVWRASYPLRRIGSRHPALSRTVRRAAKLAWWTVTLQLAARMRSLRATGGAEIAVAPPESVADTVPALPAPEPAALDLPVSEQPIVSILIATYGQTAMTMACLRAIAANPPDLPFEVIVVDDAYPGPEDTAAISQVGGLVLLRNAANLGFLRSCNQAARAARGRHLILLNNDTEVLPGALSILSASIEANEAIGLAGAKLIFPDGRLQDAGGIVWDDASGWNYGRGEDPRRPEFSYLRDVDWCTGAAMIVRRAVWDQLGGFDEAFVPAYYEDTDLAFRIRAAGYRVVLEPRALVVHHEGASHGTDLAAGIKAHQVTNQARMLERWGDVLARDHFPSGEHVLRARDRARNRRVILVIDHYAPEPDRDAGSRSILGIMEGLLDAGWVVKFWPLNRLYSVTYTTALERLGIEVPDQRGPDTLESWMRTNGSEFDHVMFVRPDTATMTFHSVIPHTGAVLSFYGVDLHFARLQRQAEMTSDAGVAEQAVRMEQWERRVWRTVDVLLYPSEEEARVVRQLAPGAAVHGIVPFYFDLAPARTAAPVERSLLFVAGFAHPPNVDAAEFLIREVIPRLEQRVGPVRVTLAGSNPTEQVRALSSRDVTVTGYVSEDELARLYANHRAAVVPLRFGAGVKGKVVQALSQGVPLVTTSIGVQGIEGLDRIVPVADEPEPIASALARLMEDDARWLAQSRAQRAFVAERFSRAAMRDSVVAPLLAAEMRVRGSQAAKSEAA